MDNARGGHDFLLSNDGRGWLVWFPIDNPTGDPMKEPFDWVPRMTVEGVEYTPVGNFLTCSESHFRTRRKAVRVGRKLARQKAKAAAATRGPQRP